MLPALMPVRIYPTLPNAQRSGDLKEIEEAVLKSSHTIHPSSPIDTKIQAKKLLATYYQWSLTLLGNAKDGYSLDNAMERVRKVRQAMDGLDAYQEGSSEGHFSPQFIIQNLHNLFA